MPRESELYNFYSCDTNKLVQSLGKEALHAAMQSMLLIRHFETRAESAYQQGKIGGFFHAYIGQEAIQTAATLAIDPKSSWWITTYRCHALALLLGEDPDSIMAELYGKQTGNALGRGGSMHLYSDRMLGGFGIVGGHVPIAAGAAFTLKYLKEDGVAVCFLGDGAVVQGAVHESLNLAALWGLPLIVVVENNQWGMGTAVKRAVAVQPIAEHLAKAYGLESMTFDGMDFVSCYGGFQEAVKKVKESGKPLLVEAVTERFRGHSISDPALYRSKEELEKAMTKDPIAHLKQTLMDQKILTEDEYSAMDAQAKEQVIASMKFAEASPDPDLAELEEDVFAPEDN